MYCPFLKKDVSVLDCVKQEGKDEPFVKPCVLINYIIHPLLGSGFVCGWSPNYNATVEEMQKYSGSSK